MARRETVVLVDDLTGAELADGETVEFGLDGRTYTIDLSTDAAQELRDVLAVYVENGRRMSPFRKTPERRSNGSGGSRVDREQTRAIREWARARGWAISDRGRIPAEVTEAYQNAA